MADKETKKSAESVRNIRNVWLSMGYDDPAIFSDVEMMDNAESEVTA